MKRRQKARPGELRVTYGRLEGDAPDVVFARGEGVSKPDGHLMCWYFTRATDDLLPLAQELERRGYDLSTMVFSIMKRSTSDAAVNPKWDCRNCGLSNDADLTGCLYCGTQNDAGADHAG